MNELLEILEEIAPEVDFENCDTLIDDKILESFAILQIVDELEEAFDIEILPTDMTPANFNSAKALWNMVCSLRNN